MFVHAHVDSVSIAGVCRGHAAQGRLVYYCACAATRPKTGDARPPPNSPGRRRAALGRATPWVWVLRAILRARLCSVAPRSRARFAAARRVHVVVFLETPQTALGRQRQELAERRGRRAQAAAPAPTPPPLLHRDLDELGCARVAHPTPKAFSGVPHYRI
ncbi:hypothetical protein EVAR_50185_1 [Eumeta japonica]|uniref:Uncharacterized protein n=1 Tax=Eumeta variegata TaxID=151549 RepID=A0A4C1WWP6_EUMVA|nr:hypothetical protein EVAR_50185_1 [Eumeta japonica]